MGPNVPSRDDDLVGREIPIPPAEQEVVSVEMPAARHKEPPEGSPLKDHLLELEQEFQDQEEEGKV